MAIGGSTTGSAAGVPLPGSTTGVLLPGSEGAPEAELESEEFESESFSDVELLSADPISDVLYPPDSLLASPSSYSTPPVSLLASSSDS